MGGGIRLLMRHNSATGLAGIAPIRMNVAIANSCCRHRPCEGPVLAARRLGYPTGESPPSVQDDERRARAIGGVAAQREKEKPGDNLLQYIRKLRVLLSR